MTRRPTASLGRRLSWWLALQALAGLAGVCLAVYLATASSLATRQAESLAQKEILVRHLLEEARSDGDLENLKHKFDDFFLGHEDLGLSLHRSDGSRLYRAATNASEAPHRREARFELPSPTAPLQRLIATLTLDVGSDRALLQGLSITLFGSAIIGAALVSAGATLLVKQGLTPVHQLVEQTRRLAADTLDNRLDGSAQPEELQPLIAQFNALLGRLGQAYAQLEGFNADVAHELCTPLATLIGGTELALRKARSADELRELLGSNLEELQRMSTIVSDMLFLSQADRGAAARRTPTPSLAAVAMAVAEYHEAALDEAGLRIDVVGDAEGAFDVALLRQAVSNLVGNATRYAVQGSAVRIDIGTSVPGQVDIAVTNQGATIAPEHLPRLFDRFYRSDPARSHADRNHGLGLSIVAAIARMHGGTPFATSADGQTTIGMRLDSGRDQDLGRVTPTGARSLLRGPESIRSS